MDLNGSLITTLNNPKNEILSLKEFPINLIANDQRIKGIITEYQFISVILDKYDYSPSQVWFINHVVNQNKNSKFYKSYKKLLINQIKTQGRNFLCNISFLG